MVKQFATIQDLPDIYSVHDDVFIRKEQFLWDCIDPSVPEDSRYIIPIVISRAQSIFWKKILFK